MRRPKPPAVEQDARHESGQNYRIFYQSAGGNRARISFRDDYLHRPVVTPRGPPQALLLRPPPLVAEDPPHLAAKLRDQHQTSV